MYSFSLDSYYQVANERKVPIYIPLTVRVYLLNKTLNLCHHNRVEMKCFCNVNGLPLILHEVGHSLKFYKAFAFLLYTVHNLCWLYVYLCAGKHIYIKSTLLMKFTSFVFHSFCSLDLSWCEKGRQIKVTG